VDFSRVKIEAQMGSARWPTTPWRYDLEVYDIAGRQVHKSVNVASADVRIDLSNLSPGSYFVRVRNDEVLETRYLIIE